MHFCSLTESPNTEELRNGIILRVLHSRTEAGSNMHLIISIKLVQWIPLTANMPLLWQDLKDQETAATEKSEKIITAAVAAAVTAAICVCLFCAWIHAVSASAAI